MKIKKVRGPEEFRASIHDSAWRVKALLTGDCIDVFQDADGKLHFATHTILRDVGTREVPDSHIVDGRRIKMESEFEALFSISDFAALHYTIRDLGFPRYPACVAAGEREQIAERFTGAAPNNADIGDVRASLSWVLVHLAAEYEREKCMDLYSDNHCWTRRIDLQIAQLVDWWIGRRDGHEHAIKHGRNFVPRSTEMATAARKSAGQQHRERVLKLAGVVLREGSGQFKTGRVNITKVLEKITVLDPAIRPEEARKVISAALKEGKLGLSPPKLQSQ